MNRNVLFLIIGCASIFIIVLVFGYLFLSGRFGSGTNETPALTKETVEIPITQGRSGNTPNVEGYKSPKFEFDISDSNKFGEILDASRNKVNELVEAKIVSPAHADQKINTYVSVDKDTKKLTVQPEDLMNFKPGLYKLSLKMRTLEGDVDIEQDFTWGVIAVNTNKSIYKPGETVKIGFGVLNDNGETLCMTGENKVDEINMAIKNPAGKVTNFSTKENSIKDSGKCGPITVTNEADFQSQYQAGDPGIYQMTIEATVYGKKRQITDYFKVDPNADFDIERTDFPTRIYPKSVYPTALTITAKSNYNGTVIDTVPGFFKIENISDGGKIVKNGDFQNIVWITNLKAGQPKTFTYFIKFPPVSPEFYLLGPIKIGNFEEARQWQIASDVINSTSGVLAYEDNGGSDTWYNIWTGAAFNSQTDMDTSGDAPDDSRWFVEKSSPKTGEKLVAAFDNAGTPISDQALWMYRWDGSAWNEDFVIDVDAAGTMDTNTRIMDIAYEELSGEAIFVYGDSSNDLNYYVRSGGSWSGPFNAGTSLDSRKRWVRAASQFESDTIVVAYLNLNERIGAQIWDGSTNTFGSQFDDDDSPAQTEANSSDEQAFDVAIETSSNTPMIFWGNSSQQLLYREFTGGAWGGENTLYTTDGDAANDIEWVQAAADPVSTSNYIAIAMQETLDNDTTDEAVDCEFGMWTGTTGETLPTAISCRSDADGRLNAVAFENTGSTAMFAYVTSANGNSLTFRTWDAGDTSPGTSTGITGDVNTGDVINSVQLHSDLNTTSMIALAADSDTGGSGADLFYWDWDGSTWTMNTTPIHDGVQNTGESAEAYGFGFDRNVERQVAYRWFANNNGTSVTTALTAQDTPYTLTSENQAFRLRLLLYTPDTITTSLRNYKLQYVDPGTGTCESPTGGTPSTWTDVPTSGGSTISFNNNATPADGDNLTVNGSLDPTYRGLTVNAQDYEEQNNFTNTVSQIDADELGLWDFSLIDNTAYDRIAQTYCFRVARSNDVVVQIGLYPQISTAALPDVLLQGGTLIQGGTRINNP